MPKNGFVGWSQCGGLCGPRYGRTTLDRELETTFGGGLLKTAAFPVQVTTYNLKSGNSVYMGSLDASTSKYTIADAARCSSAAPTYLGGVRVDQTFIGVDGGMAENNPTAAGLRQAMAAQRAYLKRFADQTPVSAHDFFVLSLGTGQLEQPARAPGLQQDRYLKPLFGDLRRHCNAQIRTYLNVRLRFCASRS